MKRRRFTAAFKAQIVQEILAGEKTATQIASEHQLNPVMLTQWKAAVLKGMPTLFDEKRHAAADQAAHETQMQELYEQMGRLTTENAWLKKNLVSTVPVDERRAMVAPDDAELSIKRQAELLELNRSSLYYHPRPRDPRIVDIQHKIDEIYTERPFFGSRKIANELKPAMVMFFNDTFIFDLGTREY